MFVGVEYLCKAYLIVYLMSLSQVEWKCNVCEMLTQNANQTTPPEPWLTHKVIGVGRVHHQKVIAVPDVRCIAKDLLLGNPRLDKVLAVVALASVAALWVVHALRCELLASTAEDDLRGRSVAVCRFR